MSKINDTDPVALADIADVFVSGEVKMMPGQKPYTQAEWDKLQGLIAGACEADARGLVGR